MKKVYGMPGVASAQIVLTSPSGKTKYKIPFTGGITNSRDKTPAKFITDSPVIQDVIESNEVFGKKIFLVNSFDSPVATQPVPQQTAKGRGKGKGAKAEDSGSELKVFEDVTNLGEAINVLMSAGSVDGASMTSIEGVLAKAQEFGISFPNLKAE